MTERERQDDLAERILALAPPPPVPAQERDSADEFLPAEAREWKDRLYQEAFEQELEAKRLRADRLLAAPVPAQAGEVDEHTFCPACDKSVTQACNSSLCGFADSWRSRAEDAEAKCRELEGEVARAKDHAREVYEIGASWSRKHAVAEALLNRELARNCNRDAPDYADRLTLAAHAARDALEPFCEYSVTSISAEEGDFLLRVITGNASQPKFAHFDRARAALASLASVLDGGEG